MELAGVIFSILSSIAFFSSSLSQRVEDILEDVKRAIFLEVDNRQKEFGRVVSSFNVIEEQFKIAVNGIRKVHFSSHLDIHKIQNSKRELALIAPIAIVGFILAFTSLVIGYFQPKSLHFMSLRNQLMVSIPFVIMILEWLIYLRANLIERKLKNIKRKYEHLEY